MKTKPKAEAMLWSHPSTAIPWFGGCSVPVESTGIAVSREAQLSLLGWAPSSLSHSGRWSHSCEHQHSSRSVWHFPPATHGMVFLEAAEEQPVLRLQRCCRAALPGSWHHPSAGGSPVLCQELTGAHISLPCLPQGSGSSGTSPLNPPWMAPDTRAGRGGCPPFTSTKSPQRSAERRQKIPHK